MPAALISRRDLGVDVLARLDRWSSRPSCPWRRDGDDDVLEHDAAEQALVQRLDDLVAGGQSARGARR